MYRKFLLSTFLGSVAALSLLAAPALAGDDADMKAEIAALRARLDQLESRQASTASVAATAQAAAQASQAAQAAAAQASQAAQAAQASQALQASQAVQVAPPVPEALKTDNSGSVLGILTQPVMLYDDSRTSMHLYGIIEATVSDWTNQPNANGNNKHTSAIGFQTAWFSGNRLGFDMDHAVGAGDSIGLPGLKVIAKLETEFESPTGNTDTPGVLFNRDAWVGFESPDLGKLTFGRQNTVTRDFTQTWGDPYGTPDVTLKEGGYSNVNNFKEIIYYSAASTLTRNDSAIIWKKYFDDKHIVLGIDYAFGSQGVGGSGNGGIGNSPLLDGGGGSPGKFFIGSSQAISLAYNNLPVGGGMLSANINYDRANCGNFGDNHCNAADPSAGNYINSNVNQSFLVGGTYVIDGYRFGAGYIYYEAQQNTTNAGNLGDRTDNVFIIDGAVPLTPSGDLKINWGAWGAISHNSALYAGNNLVVLPFFISTANSTKTVNGGRLNATTSLVYSLDKQIDLYGVVDFQEGMGGWGHALFNNQGNGDAGKMGAESLGLGSGFRFKF